MTKLFGDWDKIPGFAAGVGDRFKRATTQALLKEANNLRGLVVKGIASGAPVGKQFAPLSPITIALRKAAGFGGTKPLNRTGALRGNVVVKRTGEAVFIGILRSARAKSGKSLVNIGEIHEFGRTWTQKVTAKSRKFLFAMLRKGGAPKLIGPRLGGGAFRSGGSSSVTIRIPARPYMGPVFEQERAHVAKRFWGELAKGMGYDLSR